MEHLFVAIQVVEHAGNNGLHPVVDSRGEPRCPTAFRIAGNNEVIDGHVAVDGRHVGLHRIQRANDTLDHRQEDEPVLVAGGRIVVGIQMGRILIHRVRDDGVFATADAIAGEGQRLVGDRGQINHDAARCQCCAHERGIGSCRRGCGVGPSIDEQQAG